MRYLSLLPNILVWLFPGFVGKKKSDKNDYNLSLFPVIIMSSEHIATCISRYKCSIHKRLKIHNICPYIGMAVYMCVIHEFNTLIHVVFKNVAAKRSAAGSIYYTTNAIQCTHSYISTLIIFQLIGLLQQILCGINLCWLL